MVFLYGQFGSGVGFCLCANTQFCCDLCVPFLYELVVYVTHLSVLKPLAAKKLGVLLQSTGIVTQLDVCFSTVSEYMTRNTK